VLELPVAHFVDLPTITHLTVCFIFVVCFEADASYQNEVSYEAFMNSSLREGSTDLYSAMFPSVDGANEISMTSHRSGVASFYVFQNKSSSTTLNETIGMTLENQIASWVDEDDERFIDNQGRILDPNSASDALGHIKANEKHQYSISFQLEPGKSKMLALRPLSADAASSKMSRSCSLKVSLTDTAFIDLCKKSGQVSVVLLYVILKATFVFGALSICSVTRAFLINNTVVVRILQDSWHSQILLAICHKLWYFRREPIFDSCVDGAI
jgi:hypothetical protein